jgi:hypothetical protein
VPERVGRPVPAAAGVVDEAAAAARPARGHRDTFEELDALGHLNPKVSGKTGGRAPAGACRPTAAGSCATPTTTRRRRTTASWAARGDPNARALTPTARPTRTVRRSGGRPLVVCWPWPPERCSRSLPRWH